MHALSYSGAFDIEAQALNHEGLREQAIDVLRKGLNIAPDGWLNANLLGNYLSDAGRYDEAFNVYEAALRIPAVDRCMIEANYAKALHRSGRDDEARAKISSLSNDSLSLVEPELRAFIVSVATDLTP